MKHLITAILLASLAYQPFYALGDQELALPAPDVSAPQIEHEQFTDHQPVGQALEFMVKAVDESGIENVTLFYRVIGAEEFERLEMIKLGEQGIYSATIPSDEMHTPGIEYYIQAADTAGNTRLRGFDFSPLIVLVGSPGLEKAVHEAPVAEAVAEPEEGKKESGVTKWVLIGLGVAALAGLGIALGGGGGGGDGGGGSTGSVTVDAPVPQ